MKLYIYTDYKNQEIPFESSRVRKNFKGLLELINESYATQNATAYYNIAQYFTINDVTTLDLETRYRNIINGVTIFYNECESENGIFSKDKDGVNYLISKSVIDKINTFDFVIVPSEKARSFLRKEGVYNSVFVLNPGIKFSKFEFNDPSFKDIFYRVVGLNKDTKIIVSVIKDDDYEAVRKIVLIANQCKNYKYVVLSEQNNRKLVKKNKKYFNKCASNIMYLPLLDDDAYSSLMFNADIFINVNSFYSNVVEIMEAMASKTQIFSLKSSIFEDILVDNENAYIYNDLGLLIEGINKYINGELISLKEKAYEYAKNYSLLTYGSELVKVYKKIEEEVKKND